MAEDENDISDVPAAELAEVLDYTIWNMSGIDFPTVVPQWLAYLQARPDADTPEIQAAIAVCNDYLHGP